jgi:hypothetical protein
MGNLGPGQSTGNFCSSLLSILFQLVLVLLGPFLHHRQGYANGYKPKRIDTPAGSITVEFPKIAGHMGEPVEQTARVGPEICVTRPTIKNQARPGSRIFKPLTTIPTAMAARIMPIKRVMMTRIRAESSLPMEAAK